MRSHGQRWSSFFCLLLFFLLSQSGCRNPCETVEMALRAREQDLRALKEEVCRLQGENEAMVRQLHDVKFSPTMPGGGPISPEYASQTYTLKRITLGRGTGGYNEDKKPSDEALRVIIEPRDMSDDIIKAPGTAQITALEISPEGLKSPFSTWNISAEQLRKSWQQGLFSNGYVLTLPWQQPPKSKQVRVVVRFKLSDGRVFEADKDITVNPGPMILPGPKTSNVTEPLWPGVIESLPVPKEGKPAAMNPPVRPGDVDFQETANWQPASLNGAVQLMRPEPLYARPSSGD